MGWEADVIDGWGDGKKVVWLSRTASVYGVE